MNKKNSLKQKPKVNNEKSDKSIDLSKDSKKPTKQGSKEKIKEEKQSEKAIKEKENEEKMRKDKENEEKVRKEKENEEKARKKKENEEKTRKVKENEENEENEENKENKENEENEENEEEGKNEENDEENNEKTRKEKEIDSIVKNLALNEKDEKFLALLAGKLQNLDEKIISLQNTVDETSDKERIRKKQSEINENLEKLIQQVKENDFEHKSLDKQKDVKKSIENTIIEIFSHNQKLQDLVEDMKKGFYLKNQQIFTLQEELMKYQIVCKEQEKQIEYLENRLSGKEKLINQYQDDPKKKLAEINEKLREMQIETKVGNYKENYENPNNNDPYDIWKTNDEDNLAQEKSNNKSQKLEDILGNKNNLWILKHETELNQSTNVQKTYKR